MHQQNLLRLLQLFKVKNKFEFEQNKWRLEPFFQFEQPET